jgi:hypothetical protein
MGSLTGRRAGYVFAAGALLTMTLAVALPMQGGNDKAKTVQSLSNLKRIEWGVLMYAEDYDERLPPMDSIATVRRLTNPYLGHSPQLWHLYGVPEGVETYAANAALSHKALKEVPHAAEVALVYESGAWHGRGRYQDRYRVVGYADSHVKTVPEKEWPAIRQISDIAPDPPPPIRSPWWAFWRPCPHAAIQPDEVGGLCAVLWAIFTFMSAGLCATALRGGRRQGWFFEFVVHLLVITMAIGILSTITGILAGGLLLSLLGIS